ncbi:uncharacterized protein LOC144871969 [Branchiostoma floridae x Branchiostoma japonicum]
MMQRTKKNHSKIPKSRYHEANADNDDVPSMSDNSSSSSQDSLQSEEMYEYSSSEPRTQDGAVPASALETMTEDEALAYAIQLSLLTGDISTREDQLSDADVCPEDENKEKEVAMTKTEDKGDCLSFQIEVNKTYDELLSSAQSCVDAGLYSAAEKEFAAALKIACRENEDKAKVSFCLQRLGDVYLQLGAAETKDASMFVKSVALYNSALVRCKDAERCQCLVDSLKHAERKFLEGILSQDASQIASSRYSVDLEHKMVLQSIREMTREALAVLNDNFNPYSPALTQQQRMDMEKERCIGVQAVFKEVHEALRQFLRKLLSECFDALGDPPCGYTIIGLGSFARKEMTPYSDIEFAILVDDASDGVKQFFMNVSRYLHIKVLNLGETILPSVGIKSLNDFYSEDPTASWFYDDGPRGLSFDGAMPWACKVPYGRPPTKNKPFALDLVKTPKEMAQLQTEDRAANEGYHLSEVMEQTAFIAGDTNLLEDYRARVRAILDTPTGEGGLMRTVRTKRHLTGMQSDVAKFHTVLHDLDMAGRVMQAKRDMHRLPSLIVSGLGLFHGCKSHSPWDIVDELEQRGNLDPESSHNIRVLISIANEMRLRTYLDHNSQQDSFSSLPLLPQLVKTQEPSKDKTQNVYHFPTTDMISRYYYTMIPLEETIKLFVEEIARGEGPPANGLRVRTKLYDDGPISRAFVHLHLLQFEEAKQSLHEALQKTDRDSSPDKTCSILYHAGTICVELGLHEEARKCFQEALEIWPRTTSSAARLQAQLLNAIGATFVTEDPATMRRYCQESLRVRTNFFQGEVPSEEEAGVSQNIAISWIKEGKHSKAVESFSKALSAVGDGFISPFVITVLSNLSGCYGEMGLFEEATVYAERAANMAKTLYGEDTAHPTLAVVLFALGKIYSQRELYQDALSCHSLALQIRNRLYGKEATHERRAEMLKAVAYSLLRLNEYDAAIHHYEEALATRRSTEKCVYYNTETVSLLNLLGHAHTMCGNQEKATEYQNEAIKVGKAICSGREDYTKTEEMVDSLLYLAQTHVRQSNYQQAVEFYKAFFDARQQLPGFRSDQNVVRALNNLGVAYMALGEDSAAAAFFTEALDTLRNAPDENAGRVIVACVCNLGHVLYNLGDYEAARGHYEEIANKKRRGESETADMDAVVLLSYLAATYQKLDDHNHAIEMCQEALEIHKGDCIVRNPATMGKIHKILGRSLLFAKRHSDAIAHLEKAVDLLQALDVEEKTQLEEIVTLHQDIAKTYSYTGQSQSAAANFTRALGTLKMIHGEDACHIDIAGTMFNMGKAFVDFSRSGVLFSKSYRERAALLFEEAVTMTRRLDNDLDTQKLRASCLNNMADLHFDLQDFEKAATFYEELSREVTSLPVGTYSDLEATALFYNLGVSFQRSSEAKKAIPALERSLEIKRLILTGEDGMYSIAMTLQALGDSLFIDHRYAEAVNHLQEAMEMRRSISHGHNTLEMSSTLNSLGLALFSNGDKEKGIKHLQDAVQIRREVLGAFHPKLAESLSNLGNIYAGIGATKEEIICYKEALGIWEDFYGRTYPSDEVITALYTIANAYARLEEEDEAATYYRRTLHEIRSLVRMKGKLPDGHAKKTLRTVSVLLIKDSPGEEHDVPNQDEHTGEMEGMQQVLEVVTYLARYMTVTPPENGDLDLVMLALLVITDKRLQLSTNHDAEKAIAKEFAKRQGAVSLASYVMHVSTTVTSSVTSSPQSVDRLWQDVVTFRTAVWSLSAHGGEFCRQLAEGGLLTYLLTELGEGAGETRPTSVSGPPDFRLQTFLLTSATSILYNCARVHSCRHHLRHDDKLSVLRMRHILDGDDVTIVRDVILTLAHIISDGEGGFDVDVPSVREDVIQDFLTTMETSLEEISPEYSEREMLLGVKFLVQNEENKEKIISQKGVGLIEKILEGGQEDVLEIAANVTWLLLQ